GNTISFANATVVPGDTLTLTVSGTVSPSASGALTNTATVVAGAGSIDTNAANNTATDTDTLGTAQVDLAITKTDGQTTYVPGAVISYTITVTNAGPSVANGFSVSDVVPASLTGVTASCAVVGFGGCGTNTSVGNSVSLTNASLAPGAVNTLTITVTGTVSADTTGPLTNTATVTAGARGAGTNPANHSGPECDHRARGLRRAAN